MLSLGTELDFALAIASARVGLPAGSPPPVRAATSTFLMSLANSLPRRASTTAFLCLVVAHLLCPLILGRSQLLPPDRHEQLMPARVTGELGMERRRQQRTLSYGDDPTGGLTVVDPRERLHPLAQLPPSWRPDEHCMHRFL